ncbi:uncharacterized protein SCHCODRAFT_02644201 [Schizophyllum commune H4-8]|uniref:uncharacterized protein n=1 Tax=Schizophyllum commune (strain H4-8 / FGSC 9210) TaxID=578458 RepID=UPI00215EFC7A|nr:uncharacterized protein SCHCODRAFT_02644201 [Schizophyllum commune H4-8]KAI5885240.1 hypothetical protein SCHCODRAFT_02644201 [Schizophyllum commune H4-8]
MHPVRDIHLERLNHACRNIYDIKDSGVPDVTARMRINEEVSKVLGVLRRGTLQNIILAHEPPTAMPLLEFVSHEDWDARADLVGQTLACSGLLCNLSFILHRHDLCPFDARFFLAAFAWMDYLTPPTRIADLASADAGIRSFYIATVSHICVSFLQGFAQFLPQERVREVMHSGDERATDVMARLWMSWPDILGHLDASPDPTEKKSVIYGSILVLPTHYNQVESDSALRRRVVDSIMVVTNRRPRRFFRVYAHHIRYTIQHPFENDEQKVMNSIIRALDLLSKETRLNLSGRLPRKLVSAVIDCLLHHIRLAPSAIVWRMAWKCLAGMCLRDAHNFTHAIEFGLLGCMVIVRTTVPEMPLLSEMYRVFGDLSQTPRALRAFRIAHSRSSALREVWLYNDQESSIAKTYEYYEHVLDQADKSWAQTATCCNAACPLAGGQADALRSCSCGDALYCSEACQRAHWVDGHTIECASRHPDVLGTLSSKELNYLIAEARVVLQNLFDGLPAEPAEPGSALKVFVDTRIRENGWPSLDVSKEKALSRAEESPRVAVDIVFEQGDDLRIRRIWFLPERYAGYVRHSYRLLSQAFFEGRRHQEPPRLANLTPRERLFGRSEGTTRWYPQDVR